MMQQPVATPGNGKTTIFDDYHAPSLDLLNSCVHCGWCLQNCPTYTLWGKEGDSPRGRVYLMNMASEGKAGFSDLLVEHFDHCLGCFACVATCPSGVKYSHLIEDMRGQIERHYRRPMRERLLRRMIKAVFPYPSRLRALALPLRAYQRLGLQHLAREVGLTALLPRSLQTMEKLLPQLSHDSVAAPLPAHVPAQGEKRCTVALLTGCVQDAFFSHVNAATARVLSAEGCEVFVPPDQGCCGALMIDLGQEQEAAQMARRLIDRLEPFAVDAIVVNTSCGATVKDYGYLLRDDPQYRERAAAFSAKCKDVSEVLAGLTPRAARRRMKIRAAYHDPCHLQHAQGLREPPRAALRTIPGLEIVELPESALCCGSAGAYNLVQPETARALGERKARNIAATDAEMVITANPGCQLQIGSLLNEKGHPLPVVHYIELLDASISGRKFS